MRLGLEGGYRFPSNQASVTNSSLLSGTCGGWDRADTLLHPSITVPTCSPFNVLASSPGLRPLTICTDRTRDARWIYASTTRSITMSFGSVPGGTRAVILGICVTSGVYFGSSVYSPFSSLT